MSSSNASPKLPKLLAHSHNSSSPARDRSKSVGPEFHKGKKKRSSPDAPPIPPAEDDDDIPVVVEPTASPRPSTSFYASAPSSHSTSRLNDLPSRLSGWLSHFSSSTHSGNTSDSSLSSVLAQHPNAAKLAVGATVSSTSKGRLSLPGPSSSSERREKLVKSPPIPLPPQPIPTPPPPIQSELSSSTSSTNSASFKLPGAVSQAAKSSSRAVDRAFRYLRDTDNWDGAEVSIGEEEVWLLGRRYDYPGLRPISPVASPPKKSRKEKEKGKVRDKEKKQHTHQHSLSSASASSGVSKLSLSSDRHHSHHHHSRHYHRHRDSANTSATSLDSQPEIMEATLTPPPSTIVPGAAGYPPGFYDDFVSIGWMTYRKEFGVPIRDCRLADLESESSSPLTNTNTNTNNNPPQDEYYYSSSASTSYGSSSSRSSGAPTPSKNRWINISLNSIGIAERVGRSGLLGEKGWTSDTGWGCMLRTGQSLLVESLRRVWVGAEYRPFEHIEERSVERARWVRVLSWFIDHPGWEAPFSVHRMALAGKELGKDVGMWFGPSTAAGALRTLVNAFPMCQLGVCIASDGVLYQTEVFAASRTPEKNPHPTPTSTNGWGDRAVLVLFGIRLGIEGVNPIYYETIKQLYTFPQTVGIAGGRPSSSYYFVGVQGETHLFYLDPHHTRPGVPLKSVPPEVWRWSKERGGSVIDVIRKVQGQEDEVEEDEVEEVGEGVLVIGRVDASIGRETSFVDFGDDDDDEEEDGGWRRERRDTEKPRAGGPPPLQPPKRERRDTAKPSPRQSNSGSINNNNTTHKVAANYPTLERHPSALEFNLDPLVCHYLDAYTPEELGTFHCEKVKRMPMSGLDPSMLIGFLVTSEEDWRNLRRRVAEMPKAIFSIADEPPRWASRGGGRGGTGGSDASSDDVGFEFDEEEEEEEERVLVERRNEVDTEDSEPGDPVTPGPTQQRFVDTGRVSRADEGEEGDSEWVESSLSPPPTTRVGSREKLSSLTKSRVASSAKAKGKSKMESSKKYGKNGGGSKKREQPVPVPQVRLPFPVAEEDDDDDDVIVGAEGVEDEEGFVEMVSHDEDDEDGLRTRKSSVIYVAQAANTGGSGIRGYAGRTARDGGRTVSGGVRGVLSEDSY